MLVRTLKRISLIRILLITAILFTSIAVKAQDGYIGAKNFAESQNIAYQWFPIQKMLVMRKGLKSVKLKVNDPTAIIDGKAFQLPAPPRIQDGQIMVPANAIVKIFQGEMPGNFTPSPPKPAPEKPTDKLVKFATTNATALNSKPPIIPSNEPKTVTPPSIQPQSLSQGNESILVALRHSSREDHTRVVLEFNSNVTYSSEFQNGIYKLRISGCKNLVPTKKTNPVGKDIKSLAFNSGPNRSGLVLTFGVKNTRQAPTIETVGGPFRMIISFPSGDEKEVPTPPTQEPEKKPEIQEAKKPVVEIKAEVPPEINIEVLVASLTSEAFLGRTVVIDPGHGGSDFGVSVAGRGNEKEIVLHVANYLKQALEKRGLNGVILRMSDTELTASQRISIANRNGADLYISLHTGGSSDLTKSGVSCIVYGKAGTVESDNSKSGLEYITVYEDWLKKTRFDLGTYLGKKIEARLRKHLQVESRGLKALPLLPLKFIMNPAVLVEIGMLTEKVEGKNLISSGYQKAIAESIANGVSDFFNGIVLKP